MFPSFQESVLTALFHQVSQFSIVTSVNLDEKRRNHFEVLRCYDVLIRNHHREKLLSELPFSAAVLFSSVIEAMDRPLAF